nr:NgoPII family restriction endonuclease [Testudinibacter aquarius]
MEKNMANIINAIINLVREPQFRLREYATGRNRANNMGESLEEYIKDLFADTVNENNEQIRTEKISSTFSYLGNQNNPPDMILKQGDAIEVKKIELPNSSLALNSSYPKAKLFSSNPMLKKACRECDGGNWIEKDMIYSVGVVDNDKLTALCFVYGDDYCATQDVYEQIKMYIKKGITQIEDVEFSETKELGRVNKVDPLGITYLRIRGMWGIENPFTVFNYIYTRNPNCSFNFMAIINDEKFNSLENKSDLFSSAEKNNSLVINDIKIKDPNNPAKLKNAKLITFLYSEE